MGYSVRTLPTDGIETVQLADSTRDVQLGSCPLSQYGVLLDLRGRNFLQFPYNSVADFARQPRLCAVRFWAWRTASPAMVLANGKRYVFNPDLGNLRRDGNKNRFTAAQFLKGVEADGGQSRRQLGLGREPPRILALPDMVAQFPFRIR